MTGTANSVIVALLAIALGTLSVTTDVTWWKLAVGGLAAATAVGLTVDWVRARRARKAHEVGHRV